MTIFKRYRNYYFKLSLIFISLNLVSISNILAAPVASFNVGITSGCSPLTVSFTNTSTNAVKYFWRLGNGATSTNVNPGVIYTNPGTYTVTLIVEDVNGAKDSIIKKNIITVFNNPNADFSVNKTSGCPPLKVDFKDLSSPGSANINSYVWDFGDGNTSTAINPIHTYTSGGVYDVILVVRDANGCRSNSTKVGLINVSNGPDGNFRASDSSSCFSPFKVTFSTFNVANTVVGFNWDFGDGNKSTSKNPTNTYATSGYYTVSLTLTENTGCTRTIKKNNYIFIGKPKAAFKINNTKVCAGQGVYLENTTAITNGFRFLWRFGDGRTDTSYNTTVVYKKGGKYDITLIVTNPLGCKDSLTVSGGIEVIDLAKTIFTVNDTIACDTSFQFKLQNTTVGGTVVEWDFGNKTKSTLENPTVVYGTEGQYTITLVTMNSAGCRDTLKIGNMLRISKPKPLFRASKLIGCAPLTVVFTNSSSSPDKILSYRWDFDDGLTSTQISPTHTFSPPPGKGKNYNVRLTIRTQRGCEQYVTRIIKAGYKPGADFVADITEGCISEMLKVQYTLIEDSTKAKIDSQYWELGGPLKSSFRNPVAIYDIKSNIYDVKLIVFSNGCSDTILKKNYITIKEPFAQFIVKQNNCDPATYSFKDSSKGASTLYYRIFNDSKAQIDSINNRNFNYTFGRTSGLQRFSVVQYVYNNGTGCTDTFARTILIPPVFNVNLKHTRSANCAPVDVNFNLDIFPQFPVIWDLGDGDTASGYFVNHLYKTGGEYTVTLKVKISDSCFQDFIFPKYIIVPGPRAKFKVTSGFYGCTPLVTTILDSSTSNSTATKSINWGDGTPSVVYIGKVLSHTYTTYSSDPIKGFLIVQTIQDGGCISTFGDRVVPVSADPTIIVSPAPSCVLPQYYLTTSAYTRVYNSKVEWTMPDGKIEKENTVTLIVPSEGKYRVKLRVETPEGCVDTSSRIINAVKRKLSAKLTLTGIKAECPPLLVSFLDKSDSGYARITRYKWYFGDGTVSSLRNPGKIYNVPGSFGISLVVTDAIGCKDSLYLPNQVNIKGPTGSYKLSKTKGCEQISLIATAKSLNATKFSWDMGDGNILIGDSVAHTYTFTGRFAPRLILSDAFGCTYTLPARDTVYVYKSPKSNFDLDNECVSAGTKFSDLSISEDGAISKWRWAFGDGDTSVVRNPIHLYRAPGVYFVTLKVTSSNNCIGYLTKRIKISGVRAYAASLKPYSCIGVANIFQDKSLKDTTIKSWLWSFGDNTTSNSQNPVHTYFKKGFYSISLIVTDINGCVDSTTIVNHIVGDTVQPNDPNIYRVTVENDYSARLEFQSYKDIDFRKYIIYRTNAITGQLMVVDSVKNRNDTTYISRGLTTNFKSYCYRVRVQLICGPISNGLSQTHCTIDLKGNALQNQSSLTWNPYAGWKGGVKEYRVYRNDARNPQKFALFATTDGNTNSFIDSSISCGANFRYRILAIEQGGNNTHSWSDTAYIRSNFTVSIPPAKLIRASVENNKTVTLDWLGGVTYKSFRFRLEKSTDGVNYFGLDSLLGLNQFNYTDNDVFVNENSYYYRVRIMDTCGNFSTPSAIGKTIYLKADTSLELLPKLSWSAYQDWEFGVAYYDVYRRQNDGTWLMLGTKNGNDTSFTDNISPIVGQSEYCYYVVAHKNGPPAFPNRDINIVSNSNIACSPVRTTLYIPSAFSPNNDGINDRLVVKGLYIKNFKMTIFNRWGQVVFKSENVDQTWDGTMKSEAPIMDVYHYSINALGSDGKPINVSGNVTLIP